MTPAEISRQLQGLAAAGDDVVYHSYRLTDSWSAAGVGSEAVEPVLRFMEQHPNLDYGMPGPLVHFVECFGKRDYDDKLLESLERQPTSHTVGMLNRLINGAESPRELEPLVAAMERVTLNPRADSDTVERATHYLERLAQ